MNDIEDLTFRQIQFLPLAKLLHSEICALHLSPRKKKSDLVDMTACPPALWSHFSASFASEQVVWMLLKSTVSRYYQEVFVTTWAPWRTVAFHVG